MNSWRPTTLLLPRCRHSKNVSPHTYSARAEIGAISANRTSRVVSGQRLGPSARRVSFVAPNTCLVRESPCSAGECCALPVMYKPDKFGAFLSRLPGGSITRGCSLRPLRCLVIAICAP